MIIERKTNELGCQLSYRGKPGIIANARIVSNWVIASSNDPAKDGIRLED
jgi:hypothetical protein